MTARRSSLRQRMLLALLCCFLPMLAAITLLFGAAWRTQQQAEAQALCYAAQDIAQTIDRYVEGVYSVSDAFSTDERLLQVLDRDYGDDAVARQYAILHTNGAVFESYARLVQQKKIDAIYVVNRRDVLDFLDVNQDPELVLAELIRLDVNSKDKLGRFCFYPLMDNFLTASSYGEVRRDHVVLGSRRVYSALKSGYPYVHIFAIEERMFYELYEMQARHRGAEAYILDAEGRLISSTSEQAVAGCAAPQAVREANAGLMGEYETLLLEGRRHAAARAVCDSTGWTVLLLTPEAAWGPLTSSLYLQILGVILLCVGVFAFVPAVHGPAGPAGAGHAPGRPGRPARLCKAPGPGRDGADAGVLQRHAGRHPGGNGAAHAAGAAQAGAGDAGADEPDQPPLFVQHLGDHCVEGPGRRPAGHWQDGLEPGAALPAEHRGRAVCAAGKGTGAPADVHEHPAEPLWQQGGL